VIRCIADFVPDDAESGVGLVLQNENGHYLFFMAGTRDSHRCSPGELFYGGIGGHREEGEDWLTCAHREAREETGMDIDIIPAPVTWYVPHQGPVQPIEVIDEPRPFAFYELVFPPNIRVEGGIYYIVIYQARLHTRPREMPPDELRGIIALSAEQVVRGLEYRPTLTELLDDGAVLVTGEKYLDPQVRLFPVGTAAALAQILPHINKTQ